MMTITHICLAFVVVAANDAVEFLLAYILHFMLAYHVLSLASLPLRDASFLAH